MAIDYEALGKAAIEAPGWEWREGMLDMEDQRVVRVNTYTKDEDVIVVEGDIHIRVKSGDWHFYDETQEVTKKGEGDPPIPDFRDDGTRGCVVGLLRERYNDPHAAPAWDKKQQRWDFDIDDRLFRNVSEPEILLQALQAIPTEPPWRALLLAIRDRSPLRTHDRALDVLLRCFDADNYIPPKGV